ncbi:hypothetical protein FA15DRAFT_675677 [Coprinopsis marcescibilis]|uniref:Uncharacterized protein n=1 Tax=Coprinopsis marcescibilis TaxID=230819 RepID=A0A5C3KCT9_COPMA|nr:hypothetical protein FA15DRAFT_675677 [Coprinopsis marcescibilis]
MASAPGPPIVSDKKYAAAAPFANILIVEYCDQQIMIPRPTSELELRKELPKHIPEILIPDRAYLKVAFQTNELPMCRGSWVEISKAAWDTIFPSSLNVTRFEQWREFDLNVEVVAPALFNSLELGDVRSIKATPSDTLDEILVKASYPKPGPMVKVGLHLYDACHYQADRCLWESGVVTSTMWFKVQSTK